MIANMAYTLYIEPENLLEPRGSRLVPPPGLQIYR